MNEVNKKRILAGSDFNETFNPPPVFFWHGGDGLCSSRRGEGAAGSRDRASSPHTRTKGKGEGGRAKRWENLPLAPWWLRA